MRKYLLTEFVACMVLAVCGLVVPIRVDAQDGPSPAPEWERFRYSPYVDSSSNFSRPQQFASSLYGYASESRIPLDNKRKYDLYTDPILLLSARKSCRTYHRFKLDVF